MTSTRSANELPVLNRLREYALLGLMFGALWSLLPALAALITGSAVLEHRHGNTPVLQLIGVLCVGGAVAGAIVALLLPLARSRSGAVFVGVLALAPYMFGMAWARIQAFNLWVSVAAAVMVGGMAGWIFHRIFTEDQKDA